MFTTLATAGLNRTKRILSVLAILSLCLTLLPCCAKKSETPTNTVAITVKDYGVITVKLYPDIAPVTVENFKKLVLAHYYDGLIFHRVIKDFMIQGGAGKSVPAIKGEFAANGVENGLKHERGVLSMARAESYNSASSQFFICQKAQPHLDGNYAAFGKVTDGMDVVDRIASLPTDAYDAPLADVVIEKIRFVKEK